MSLPNPNSLVNGALADSLIDQESPQEASQDDLSTSPWGDPKNPPEFHPLTEAKRLQKLVQTLAKSWVQALRAQEELDFIAYKQGLQKFETSLQQIQQDWDALREAFYGALNEAESTLQEPSYAAQLEQALTAANIRWEGKFPEYTFHPFHLKLDVSNKNIALRFGRKRFGKVLQTFAIPRLVGYLSQQYQQVLNSRFNRDRFCRDLLAAYRIAVEPTAIRSSKGDNRAVMGKAVRLEVLYRLLTLRQETQSEYPQDLFRLDLARLLEEPHIVYEGYQFQFSPSKKATENWSLVTRKGVERQVADLSIHVSDAAYES